MVPLQLLIGMFSDGVNSLKELANQRKARASDLTGNTGARRVRMTKITKRISGITANFHLLSLQYHITNMSESILRPPRFPQIVT